MSAAVDFGATVHRTGQLPNFVSSKSLFYNNLVSPNAAGGEEYSACRVILARPLRELSDRDSTGT